VLSQWDYGVGISTKAYDELLVGTLGNVTIKFTGLNADGTKITKDLTVQVDEIIFETPYRDNSEQMAYLTGGSEKAWTWDDTQPDNGNGPAVWGNGAYLANSTPEWWSPGLAGMDETAPGEGDGAYMVFIDDGTLTIHKTNGSTETGTFSITVNTNEVTYNDDGEVWALGRLYTSTVTVLAGISPNEGNSRVYGYDVLSLDEEKMVLSYPTNGFDSGAATWSEAFFWLFKAR
ncbi:MAG: hypothetical protein LUG96_10290, partial [Tannerellaceae bacterium]|nr:hypothetical protein [Tannerellaceae bacterium]